MKFSLNKKPSFSETTIKMGEIDPENCIVIDSKTSPELIIIENNLIKNNAIQKTN